MSLVSKDTVSTLKNSKMITAPMNRLLVRFQWKWPALKAGSGMSERFPSVPVSIPHFVCIDVNRVICP